MSKPVALIVSLALVLAGCQQASIAPTIGEYAPDMGAYDRAFARIMTKWEVPGGAPPCASCGRVWEGVNCVSPERVGRGERWT